MRTPNVQIGIDAAPAPFVSISQLIANGDIATGNMMSLAAAINAVPFEPSFLGDRGIYHYEGEASNTIALEFDGQVINLIESTAPGSPGQETILNPRSIQKVSSVRIARKVTIRATEVANVRALASANMDTVETRADWKVKNAVRDIRSTLEFHRYTGATGLQLDADGATVLNNYFTLLGVAQPQYNVFFGTPGAGKWIKIGADLLNLLEDALGGLSSMTKPIALCGRTFFEQFVTSADVIQAYQYFQAVKQANNPNRDDVRYEDFEHGGIIYRQYRGQTANSGRFIPDNEAHIIVDGVPGTYLGYFCPPQDVVGAVNMPGVPIVPTVKVLDHDAGYEIQIQSNPIHINTRPAAAIKLYSSN